VAVPDFGVRRSANGSFRSSRGVTADLAAEQFVEVRALMALWRADAVIRGAGAEPRPAAASAAS